MTPSNDDENVRQLHKAYSAKTPEEVGAYYDRWAGDYETHMGNVGYAHPAMVAAMTTRHTPRGEGPILDAGAGSGIMADLLVALGYTDIFGFDASERMLAAAAARNLYADLRQMYLGRPLDYPDDRFAAVVAAGVFTEGHAPLDGLDELVRITRPGGHIVISVARTYLDGPAREKGRELEDKGLWRLTDTSERYDSTPLGDTPLPAQVFVFKVSGASR